MNKALDELNTQHAPQVIWPGVSPSRGVRVQGGRGGHPSRGSMSRGSLSWESLSREGSLSEGSLSREGPLSRGLCLGGVYIRGVSVREVSVRGSMSGGSLLGRSLSGGGGGLCPGEVSVREAPYMVMESGSKQVMYLMHRSDSNQDTRLFRYRSARLIRTRLIRRSTLSKVSVNCFPIIFLSFHV